MEQKFVNASIRKKDAMHLLLGKPAYTCDVTPKDALVVKLLRSPHAHALIESIDTAAAEKVEGIVAIYTYKDVPQKRFTLAGQTSPEPSPWDRLILDRRVRYVGDGVAIVAGETEKAVDMALRRIKVKYQVLEAVLDLHAALDNPVLVHPEEDWTSVIPVGADNKRNLVAHEVTGDGDVDAVITYGFSTAAFAASLAVATTSASNITVPSAYVTSGV
jgi:CO/xanthine dehydrogenase Mo-binding subunit